MASFLQCEYYGICVAWKLWNLLFAVERGLFEGGQQPLLLTYSNRSIQIGQQQRLLTANSAIFKQPKSHNMHTVRMKPFATTIATIMICLTGAMALMPHLLMTKPWPSTWLHANAEKIKKAGAGQWSHLQGSFAFLCTTEDCFNIAINFCIKLMRSS